MNGWLRRDAPLWLVFAVVGLACTVLIAWSVRDYSRNTLGRLAAEQHAFASACEVEILLADQPNPGD